MSTPLIFVRDGRTLPFVPVTIAALNAIRQACELPRDDGSRRSYPHALTVYMALLELANEDRSDRIAVTQKELGARAGMSRSTVQAGLSDLQAAGVLQVHERRHGTTRIENEYVIVEPAPPPEESVISSTPAFLAGDPHPPEKQHRACGPSPPTEAQESREEKQGEARKRATPKPIRYRGKVIPPDEVADAEQALAAFCAATGRTLAPRCRDGSASDALKQVIGALQNHPDASIEKWKRGIAATVANPPGWAEGPWQTGHVFGPKAAVWTLGAAEAADGDSNVRQLPSRDKADRIDDRVLGLLGYDNVSR